MMRLFLFLLFTSIGFGGCFDDNPDFENGQMVEVDQGDDGGADFAGFIDQTWHDRQLIDRCVACPECCAPDGSDDDAGDDDCDGDDCDQGPDDAGDPDDAMPDLDSDPPEDAGDPDDGEVDGPPDAEPVDGGDCDDNDCDGEVPDGGDGPDWCGQLERFLIQRCPGDSFPEYTCPWLECEPNDFLRCLETLSTGGCRPPEELADCRCHGG